MEGAVAGAVVHMASFAQVPKRLRYLGLHGKHLPITKTHSCIPGKVTTIATLDLASVASLFLKEEMHGCH